MWVVRSFIAAVRGGRDILFAFLRQCYLMGKFPGLRAAFPGNWLVDDAGSMSIGENVWVGPYSDIVVLADDPHSSVRGKLSIGDRVVIGAGANIRAAGGAIVIGNDALLGQRVSLIAANHVLNKQAPYRDLPWDPERTGVILDENVWIGAGAIVLPGCSIGRNSVVAAGAVVTGDIPPDQLWAGVPARLLKLL